MKSDAAYPPGRQHDIFGWGDDFKHWFFEDVWGWQASVFEEYRYPPQLALACGRDDPPPLWRLRLRNGDTFTFRRAVPVNREWVSLQWVHTDPMAEREAFRHGVDIRVSSIEWVHRVYMRPPTKPGSGRK